MNDKDEMSKQRDEWKLRYFNDIEIKDKEMASLKEQLAESEENTNIYSIEAEEMRKENKKAARGNEQHAKVVPLHIQNNQKAGRIERPETSGEVRKAGLPGAITNSAQSSLKEQNEKISQLLDILIQPKKLKKDTGRC
jgi:hypothetical protein